MMVCVILCIFSFDLGTQLKVIWQANRGTIRVLYLWNTEPDQPTEESRARAYGFRLGLRFGLRLGLGLGLGLTRTLALA